MLEDASGPLLSSSSSSSSSDSIAFLFFVAAAVVVLAAPAFALGLAAVEAAVSFFLEAAAVVVLVVLDVLAFAAALGFAGAFAGGDFFDCFQRTETREWPSINCPGRETVHTFLAGGGDASKSLPLSELTMKSFIESS